MLRMGNTDLNDRFKIVRDPKEMDKALAGMLDFLTHYQHKTYLPL